MSTSEWNYDFYGTYSDTHPTKPLDLMTLKWNGAIVWNASEGMNIVSYNWYIKISPNGDNDDYSKINISFVEDDATSVNNIEGQLDEVEGIYSINGIKTETFSKGINIIRYKNGKTKKVFIK